MSLDMVLPELGKDAGDEAEVSFWYVEEGEAVEEGQDMVEMVTDKAAFTVPSPATGKVKEIRAIEGDKVRVGDVMAVLEG